MRIVYFAALLVAVVLAVLLIASRSQPRSRSSRVAKWTRMGNMAMGNAGLDRRRVQVEPGRTMREAE
jgi:hypothetical protein